MPVPPTICWEEYAGFCSSIIDDARSAGITLFPSCMKSCAKKSRKRDASPVKRAVSRSKTPADVDAARVAVNRKQTAARQRKFRAKTRETEAQAVRDALGAAAKRKYDIAIWKPKHQLQFAFAKFAETFRVHPDVQANINLPGKTPARVLKALKSSLTATYPSPGDVCEYVKTEGKTQYLVTDQVVRLAPPGSACPFPGETYVLFENVNWKGDVRKSTKRQLLRTRLYAVRSKHVAMLPPNNIDPSWVARTFGPPTEKKTPRLSQPKPARIPRVFKHSEAKRRAKRRKVADAKIRRKA
jgi:hypothetical protein